MGCQREWGCTRTYDLPLFVVSLITSLFLMYLIVIRFGKIRAAVGRIYSDSTSFISLNLLIVLFSFFLGKLLRVVSWYPLVGYVVETV